MLSVELINVAEVVYLGQMDGKARLWVTDDKNGAAGGYAYMWVDAKLSPHFASFVTTLSFLVGLIMCLRWWC